MITYNDNLFHLRSDTLSLLLAVTPQGKLEQVYFGPAVDSGDAQALRIRSPLGYGSAVVQKDDAPASCMDTLSLAWSDAGRGDYREIPMELERGGAPFATDFRYEGHRVVSELTPMAAPLPRPRGECQTLEISLCHGTLELRLCFTLMGGVLLRRSTLRNNGREPVTVRKLMSACFDLPGQLEMTTFNGGWIAETHAWRTPVGPARLCCDCTTGSSSNRHNPGFLLSEAGADENHGRVYGCNLIYSGNHYSAVQRSLQGLNRVVTGFAPFTAALAPGQVLETPEAVIACSDDGFNGLSRRMHDFIHRCITPPYWQGRPRPVLYNSWEGCMFDFTEQKLLTLARKAKKLGCELFVLDDGWFGARNDDRAGLGDYTVNAKKLPRGLGGLSDSIRALGMDFGLWFEPESVNPDSELYRAHPDWVLAECDTPLLSRHQLHLDLSRPEVRDYIVEHVGGIIDRAGVRYVKWDMNRHSCALGENAHRQVLGLYDVLRRIFAPRTQVLLEGCASGGGRFDLGMLCFAPQIWCSDDTDPIERLDIQGGLSYLYPPSAFGAHVSAAPHAQTLRATPLSTRGNAAFFGALGYELDLRHLSAVEEKEIANQIAFYKKYRAVFQYGTFRRLPAEGDAVCWQADDGHTRLVGLFHRLVHAAPPYERLRAAGLAPKKRYRLTSRPQSLRLQSFGALVNFVSPVALDPGGTVLRTADRLYALPDGAEDLTVSGAALGGGILLQPQFTGTGYHKNIRTQGDFGSTLYVIEEVSQ